MMPQKARRIYNIPQPGTVAYVRYRQSLTPDHDKPIHQDRRIFLDKLQNIEGPPVVLFNDVDEDPCPPVAFEFIPRYKFTEGVVDFVSENTDFWAGCSCEGGMCKKDCSCIQDNGYHGKMFYDKHGRLTLNDNVNSVIHECNKRCSCGENCLNRVVQRGRKIPLEIFKTEKKGWGKELSYLYTCWIWANYSIGLRCPQRIPKGAFVDTYTGELITLREAEKRLLEYNDSGLSYLFDLDMFSKVHRIEEDDEEQLADPRDPAVATVDPKDIYVIDGKDYGGVTRFINHSCDPNLLIYAVTRERADDRLYDLAMFALRDIPAYTELSFSYVGDTDRREPEDGTERWDCFCGADNCKGYLW